MQIEANTRRLKNKIMKKILYTLILLPIAIFGQTQTENYIKTTTYKNPAGQTPVSQTTYFDGLGRPVQQVVGAQSATGKDIITHITYDAFGRQVKDFLPYVSSGSTGNYDPSASTNVLSYYSLGTATQTGNPNFETTTNPYSEKLLEASPLNRVFKQAAPGNDWVLGSGHEIKLDYQTNIANEVKYFKATATWNATSDLYNTNLDNTYFDANQLYKTVTKDENWTAGDNNTTQEFKNKEGQVILKRTFNNNAAHDTYYVYDQYGNLTYVLPPKASDIMNTNGLQRDITSTAVVASGTNLQLTATNSIMLTSGFFGQTGSTFKASIDNSSQIVLDNLGYQYKYDYRNRLVEKKIPGKQWEYIVYDKLDRVVATGPALSPFGDNVGAVGTMITKYDAFNRPVYTGWMAYTGTRKSLQDTQNAATVLNETAMTNNTTMLFGAITRYSNIVAPRTGFQTLTVNYYDDYANDPFGPKFPIYNINGQSPYYNITNKPKGLPTGSWTRILTTQAATTAETSYILYDDKARPIITRNTNYLGGYTEVSNIYDFSGKITASSTTHKRLATDVGVTTNDGFTYSPQDRLLTHIQSIGGVKQLLASNTYDELGQLISKKVGNTETLPLQTVDYSYNIRGWIKKINDVNTIGTDLFAFQINYNDIANTTKKLYNGNISQTFWKTANDLVATTPKNYVYTYDNLNRLTDATDNLDQYKENLSYDKNGNIQSLYRKGNTNVAATTFGDMDILSYTYDSGNKLIKVQDYGSTEGFKDGINSNIEYAYDNNGNMISDANKGITAIKYNHLNLPTTIVFGGSSGPISIAEQKIDYIYNALGIKIQKKVNYVNAAENYTTYTDYIDGYVYENKADRSGTTTPTLQYFSTAEGYVEPQQGGGYKYVFQYKDHLGNVRVSYKDSNNDGVVNKTEILEENNYYPFGMKQKGYNSVVTSTNVGQKHKYNGKELQDELGLNFYDYGARNYDPAIGRWMNIDPLAETSRRYSPYAYALDNPIRFTDPDGMEAEDSTDPPVKQTAMQRAYDSKTGNTDGLKLIVNFLNDINTYVRQKIENSDKDLTTTATSKKGGNENQKTTGKAGDKINADPFIDGAPGKATEGNKFSKVKDFVKAVKDLNSMFKKGQKSGEKIDEVIKENTKGEKTEQTTELVRVSYDPKTGNGTWIRKEDYEAQQKQSKR
jgi:RHS repeat-associated protein